jgi:hypothetical protein
MIPALVLFGLVFGRWWRFSLIAAAVAWPVALVITDVVSVEWGLIAAAVFAVGNTFGGVLVHQGVLWGVRRARSQRQQQSVPNDQPRC